MLHKEKLKELKLMQEDNWIQNAEFPIWNQFLELDKIGFKH